MDSRLIVAPGLTQEVNDKQPLIPALEKLRVLPPELGRVQALVADNGFLSEANAITLPPSGTWSVSPTT